MTQRSEYWEWSGLEQVYLEDSFVLGIADVGSELQFTMEFVLREEHPAFRRPLPNEQYCFVRGRLIFRNVADVNWSERVQVRSFDANGESDLGNIDQLYFEDGRYHLCGDWGRVSLRAEAVEAQLD